MTDITTFALQDDGAGKLRGMTASAINYTDGTVAVKASLTSFGPGVAYNSSSGRYVFAGWTSIERQATLPLANDLTVTYAYGNAAATVTETFSADYLIVDLTPDSTEECVPGSLRLGLGGKTIVDQIGGLYADVDPLTGAGTFVGTLDNASGTVTLSAWTAGASNAPTLPGLVTRLGSEAVDEVTFRAPGVPVQVGSVQIVAVDVEGNALSDVADSQGVFAATGIEGRFYYDAGVGRVRFGDWVTAAGNEGEDWYDVANVVGLNVWKPRWVLASSIRYNCVVTSYLPVDSEILGLPVERLPPDGRVPLFEAGRLVAIFKDRTTSVSSPSAGATVTTGRTDLARIWVRDSAGARVPADRYTVNLDTGTLTWATPLDLAGYVTPLTVYDRIMHKCRLSAADLSGRLDLRLPLNADYPAGSMVASVLPVGDLQGRIERVFAQMTWVANADGEYWASSVIGSAPSANYDQAQHPITCSNRSSKDRYALIFQTSSTFRVLSEARGELARDVSKNADYTLYNSLTGFAEFTVQAEGWGSGWSAGNVLRVDVIGAKAPADLALTIMEGVHTVAFDHLTVEFHGDH